MKGNDPEQLDPPSPALMERTKKKKKLGMLGYQSSQVCTLTVGGGGEEGRMGGSERTLDCSSLSTSHHQLDGTTFQFLFLFHNCGSPGANTGVRSSLQEPYTQTTTKKKNN